MTLAFAAAAWLAGVVVAALGGGSYWPLAGLAGAGTAVGWTAGGRWRLGLAIALLTTVFVAGLLRYNAARPSGEPSGAALLNEGAAVSLRGTVAEEPEQRQTSQRLHLKLEAREVDGVWQEINGGALVTTRPFPRFEYGDVLELRGRLQTPPRFEGFDYREYLARKGIGSLSAYPALKRVGSGGGSDVLRALGDARGSLGDALARSMPEPESALARGILLGERASIPRDLTQDFNDAGISHLVAISGYNVMLVAGFAVAALSWVLGRRQATVLAMALAMVFALFVGATPSVLRAAVMAQVVLGASLAGRPNSARGAVLLTGAALTAWQPSLIDDVSFQLSFAATLGIVLIARPLEVRLRAVMPGAVGMLAEPAAVTIAASLAAQPIIAASFGRLSLVALPANLLALPAFPVIMLTSAMTALGGFVSQDLGRALGDVTYLPLAYLAWLGRTAAGLPGSSTSLGDVGSFEGAFVFTGLAAVAIALARWWRRPTPDLAPTLRFRPALWAAAIIVVLSGFVWRDALQAGESDLRVSILDVGQGDAILIETPAGHRILVDGGPSGDRLNLALDRELRSSVHRIDLMVLTHAQDDHVTGLVSILERYDVGAALTSPMQGKTAAYEAWREAVRENNVPLREGVAGEWVDLGGGARLEVVSPPPRLLEGTDDDVNNSSVVLRLVYGEVSFLLTGDLAAEGEAALLGSGGTLGSTVLKVGHHGSDGSSTPVFLNAVGPRLAVMSVGADNTYGHPSPTTRLRLAGVPLLRTDQHGTVRLRTDGRRLTADVERGRDLLPRPRARGDGTN
ncbi:MAG TPA: DNA internalization-related competence protein ComEC/Rec2 [Dehalococcoidia bacterium]|nr:DNA internalization-related competence protein ComEC/Rec2 [Dehalococcoidia bacterium]